MSQARVFDSAGKETGTVELSDEIFNAPVHEAALHQALLRQLANARQGTHQTKTRGEVSGGGKKPWKQKGTGRARQGSTRAPQWRHGGTVFGPHPRGYEQKMPRKQRRLALRAALAVKSQGEQLRVLDGLALEAPRTGQMADLFVELGSGAKTLFVLPAHDQVVEKSTRNLPWVRTILAQNLNVFDVLEADMVVLTREALAQVEAQLA
jgi:large subunit ribosomal protein L4